MSELIFYHLNYQGIMENINNIFGIHCLKCNQYLSSPILQLNECKHNLHKYCLNMNLEKKQCPICNVNYIYFCKNEELEKLTEKLNTYSKIFFEANFFPEPLAWLLNKVIEQDDMEILSLLFHRRIPVNKVIDGVSPLYLACAKGKFEIVKVLLEHGADPYQKISLSYGNIEGNYQDTPMNYAIKINDVFLIQMLIKYNINFIKDNSVFPLITAVYCFNEELVLEFIKKGADINAKDDNGTPLIYLAIRYELNRVVEELIIRGANILDKSIDGSTVLHEAANKSSKLLKLLLQNGAKSWLDSLWFNKWTPLAEAVISGNIENVRLFIEAGADIAILYDGRNILQLARNELSKKEFLNSKNPSKDNQEKISNLKLIVEYLQDKCFDSNLLKKISFKS